MNSDVWINGHHLGKHPYGYTSFYYDLTFFIKKGENVIAVKVDNSLQPNSRWYSGSGIYRHVWLNIANPVHIAQWGTYITTPSVDSSSATISVRTSIENSFPGTKNIILRSVVNNESGKEVAIIETPVSLAAPGKTDVDQTIKVAATTADLHLSWDVPYEPGTLKALGRKNGIIITEEVRTTSKPAAIRLSADRNDISADARDIVNIKAEIVDENGLVVPDADYRIEFTVEGDGKLIGTDNGNSQDKTMMKSKERNAFNGLALAVIQSTENSGKIRVTAVSANLKEAVLQVVTHKSSTIVNTVESLK